MVVNGTFVVDMVKKACIERVRILIRRISNEQCLHVMLKFILYLFLQPNKDQKMHQWVSKFSGYRNEAQA